MPMMSLKRMEASRFFSLKSPWSCDNTGPRGMVSPAQSTLGKHNTRGK